MHPLEELDAVEKSNVDESALRMLDINLVDSERVKLTTGASDLQQ